MNIDTLQIKRVTDNWNTHKTFVPALGELVMLNMDEEVEFAASFSSGSPWSVNTKDCPIIVLGDGTSPLEELMHRSSRSTFLPYRLIRSCIQDLTSHQILPNDIGESADKGVNITAAKSDHTHSLSKSTAESILKTNKNLSDYNCRRIRAGTSNPMRDNVGGSVGDIYIQYKQ